MADKPPYTSPVEATAIAQLVIKSAISEAEEKDSLGSSDRVLIIDGQTQGLKSIKASKLGSTPDPEPGAPGTSIDDQVISEDTTWSSLKIAEVIDSGTRASFSYVNPSNGTLTI